LYVDYCWAIVAAETLAAQYRLKHFTGPLKKLSFQELIDCCLPNEKEVYPYLYDAAVEYIKENGIREMRQYGYTGKKGTCKPKSEEEVIRNQILLLLFFILSLFFIYSRLFFF